MFKNLLNENQALKKEIRILKKLVATQNADLQKLDELFLDNFKNSEDEINKHVDKILEDIKPFNETIDLNHEFNIDVLNNIKSEEMDMEILVSDDGEETNINIIDSDNDSENELKQIVEQIVDTVQDIANEIKDVKEIENFVKNNYYVSNIVQQFEHKKIHNYKCVICNDKKNCLNCKRKYKTI